MPGAPEIQLSSAWAFKNVEQVFEIPLSSGLYGLQFLRVCTQDSIMWHMNDAATKIQARARGMKGRKLHQEKKKEIQQARLQADHSATKIQASYRGKKGRDKAKDRKKGLMQPVEDSTGHLGAKKVDDEAYEQWHGDTPGSRPVVPADAGKSHEAHKPVGPVGSASAAVAYFRNDVSGVLITEEQIRELWNHYDVNGDGHLDKNEVKRIYAGFDNFGLDEGDSAVDDIVDKYNMLGDGRVTYDEFAILMLKFARR